MLQGPNLLTSCLGLWGGKKATKLAPTSGPPLFMEKLLLDTSKALKTRVGRFGELKRLHQWIPVISSVKLGVGNEVDIARGGVTTGRVRNQQGSPV